MKTSIIEILKLLPKSDQQLAKEIGISSKTIQRIKAWVNPSERIQWYIENYLEKLQKKINDFIS